MLTLDNPYDPVFSRVDHALLGPLSDRLELLSSDVVVLSDDLTNRNEVAAIQRSPAILD